MSARFTTPIDARGSRGNIFEVIGTASALMQKLGIPRDEISTMQKRVMETQDYQAALDVVREWFPVVTESRS